MPSIKVFVCIVGQSGCGKSSIVRELCKKYKYKAIESYTTRPRRNKCETGHIFISDKEADDMLSSRTPIIAFTRFGGYRYFSVIDQVEQCDLFIVDPSGLDFFKRHYKGPKVVKSVYIECDDDECLARMQKRGDTEDQIHGRSLNDIIEFFGAEEKCDCTIRNDNLNDAVEALHKQIVRWEEYANTKPS